MINSDQNSNYFNLNKILTSIPENSTSQSGYKCLFLDTFYNQFLINLYSSEPELINQSYSRQLQKIISTNNGDSDFYSLGLKNAGWQAEQIVINSPYMQAAWAKENCINADGELLILEQVIKTKPDVIYCQDLHMLSANLLIEMRKHCQLLVGQIATSITKIPIKCYDVIVSSILPIVEYCRSKGVTSFYIPLAFAPRVKEGLELPKSFKDRPIDCSFVGSISSEIHRERLNLLEYLVKEVPIKFFGIGAENLPAESLIRSNYYGQAWGPELFRVLGNSKITVNRHAEVKLEENSTINATDEFANNMRLFEATGMGALLITEYRDNLVDLFEIGKEIVVYRSADECAELIKYYLARPEQAEKIALAGQARTLKDHNYQNRMNVLASYLSRLIYLKNENTREIDYQKISYDYKNIDQNEINNNDVNAWKSPEIVGMQRDLVHQELTKMYQGELVMPFKSLSTVLSRVMNSHDNILEIGCSSGYYYEVLSYLIAKKFTYTGVDYSEAMINFAKSLYPETPFYCASGDKMPFSDYNFDLTISGGVLLHCPNYADHIKETVRVTKRCIVLSRTPISRNQKTRYFRKKAYGVETVELIFNEREIVEIMAKYGFKLTHYLELDSDEQNDNYTITYSFSRI